MIGYTKVGVLPIYVAFALLYVGNILNAHTIFFSRLSGLWVILPFAPFLGQPSFRNYRRGYLYLLHVMLLISEINFCVIEGLILG